MLGCEVGDSEDGVFWTAFLRSLRARGLEGVQLVISDHHLGLKAAIASVMLGAPGSVAGSTSCATCCRKCPRPAPRWRRRRCARSSPSPMEPEPELARSLASTSLSSQDGPDLETPPIDDPLRAAALTEVSAEADQ